MYTYEQLAAPKLGVYVEGRYFGLSHAAMTEAAAFAEGLTGELGYPVPIWLCDPRRRRLTRIGEAPFPAAPGEDA